MSSTGGVDELAVPHTVTPCSAAAAKSITELRMPEATRSLSRGSRANSSAGNGTRSRSVTTMSKPASASASSSPVAKCRVNPVTSTRSWTELQSATVVAMSW